MVVIESTGNFILKEGSAMKRLMIVAALAVAWMFSLSVIPVMAQPVDYCEGNFDNDQDQDGTDAFVFKQDFGRSSLLDPCPVIECQTAEQLEMRIVQLETLLANVARVIVDGHDTIRLSGVNVQIVDGSGNTSGTVNGLGNLIVGYNELRGSGNVRTGSHNIVVGTYQNYSSYGGLVAGYRNTVSAGYASVSGGADNTANGSNASVSGGLNNTASAYCGSVSGGDNNIASGRAAGVSGGRYNEASGDYSFVGGGGYTGASDGNEAFGHYSAILGGRSNIAGDPDLTDHTFAQSATVSGGQLNIASGSRSTVSGGFNNTATAWGASVSGGEYNTASGLNASVSGGRYNVASGDYSFAGGGGGETVNSGNTAFGHYSSTLGGYANIAGDPMLSNHTIGVHSSVSGGYDNEASGDAASVSGGVFNEASGPRASVSGGLTNTASGDAASVSGGCGNEASGQDASVSGGLERSATTINDWAAGSLYENY
jgi:hypothetical protein